jgi:hypothetical protein
VDVADGHPHAELITALRGLADTLSEHPEMPMPEHVSVTGCMSALGDEEESLRRVQLAAETLGVGTTVCYSEVTRAWHHVAAVDTGPVRIALSHLVYDADGGAS